MNILGIHYGHDANVALIRDGKTVFAISEERLNRKKLYRGIPFLSIQETLSYTGLNPGDIDIVALVNSDAQEETLGGNLSAFYSRINKKKPLFAKLLSAPISLIDNIFGLTVRRMIAKKMVIEVLETLGFDSRKTCLIDHHLAHAAGAFFPSGFSEAVVVTVDGKGDHVSHRTYIAQGNKLTKLYESKDYDSAGFFYSCITSYLGFKKLRHEGKITGLAAYGDFSVVKNIPCPVSLSNNSTAIRNILITDNESNNHYYAYFKLFKANPILCIKLFCQNAAIMAEYSQFCLDEYFKKHFQGVAREHVAAFAQKHIEHVVSKLVSTQARKSGIRHVCLSGGTFGNVRLNQKISDIDGVEAVYVQPAMGDTGLSVGAALWQYWHPQKKWENALVPHVYFGPKFNDNAILSALKKHGKSFKKVNDIEKIIAEALSKEKIVGRFNGAMEWGPRALGNRSILASAGDVNINQVLNKRLNRTEFMPFAPIILEEFASQYFKNYDSSQPAARFMTITYDVVNDKIQQIPAVVHVDGTARPQVVRKEDNPSLYNVLSEYYRLTGIPVLINTSFNMHEEPIVCDPEDAIRAFEEGAVDLLAIGNYIVYNHQASNG